jgi:hypothetical protein
MFLFSKRWGSQQLSGLTTKHTKHLDLQIMELNIINYFLLMVLLQIWKLLTSSYRSQSKKKEL